MTKTFLLGGIGFLMGLIIELMSPDGLSCFAFLMMPRTTNISIIIDTLVGKVSCWIVVLVCTVIGGTIGRVFDKILG